MTGTTPLSAIGATWPLRGSPVSPRLRPPMRRPAWLSAAPPAGLGEKTRGVRPAAVAVATVTRCGTAVPRRKGGAPTPVSALPMKARW
jgi:hypothetical protein